MSVKDDGGAAFPEAGLSGLPNGDVVFGRPGMTLRDFFAAKALQSLVLNAAQDGYSCNQEQIKADTDAAYQWADAMLLARKS